MVPRACATVTRVEEDRAPVATRPVYVRLAQEIRQGARAALEARFEPPAPEARAHRVVHAFALPFNVLRVVTRDARLRRAWLEVLVIELAFVVPLGVAIALESDDVADALAHDEGWRAAVTDLPIVFLGALFGALSILEWVAIALAHELHDALAFDASRATNVPGEPLSAPPRVRVDRAWLWTKAKRKLRGLVLLALGAPAFAPVLAIPRAGDAIFATLLGAWGAYWAAVFALANTHLAWERDADPPDPWFMRVLARAGRVPLVGWVFRLYARIARRFARSAFAACGAFEEAPWEAVGLGLARAAAGVPCVWLAVRPMFGPAATHALLGARHAAGRSEPSLRSSDRPASPPGRSP